MMNPTDTPDLSKLSPQMRELVLLRLKKRQAAEDAIPRVPRPDGLHKLPLSHMQRRLWFLDHYLDAPGVYTLAGRLHLHGPFDHQAADRALNLVLERHEILRTSYDRWEEVQWVHPHVPVATPLEDLSAEADPVAALTARLQELARAPITLDAVPALRAHWFRLGPESHVLFLAMHHIAGDARATAILVDEWTRAYHAFVGGETPRLPDLPIQYGDYAAWQQGREAAFADKLAYWVRTMADPPVLDLCFQGGRPKQQQFDGALHRFVLPGTAALQTLAREEKTTPFAVALAAFHTLLYRYTGQTDVVAGVPFANRERPETRDLIGLFVNTLPVRTAPRGDLSFRAYLAAVSRAYREAQAHQDVPFERLVEALDVTRDTSHTPLYQVTFNHVVAPAEDEGPDFHEVFPATSRFDLSLALLERGDTLLGELATNPVLFDETFASAFAAHYSCLLQAACARPDTRLGALPYLDPETLARICAPKHGALPAAGPDPLQGYACLADAFEAAAAAHGTRMAVQDDDTAFTYAELDARANHIARELRVRGVGPEQRVGICLPRDARLVAAILGVLKAGAAYVPIDPDYPEERRRLIAQDAGLALVLATGADDAFPDLALLTDLDGTHPHPPTVARHREAAAYVIYTSGSTGTPKGVVVAHAGVLALMGGTQPCLGFGAESTWTLFHSYAFDFTVWELWGALLFGGRLVVVSRKLARDPVAFRALLARERVTVLSQSPSAFQQLTAVETAAAEALPDLRTVVFGAEALQPAVLQPWFARYGDRVAFVNMYGITETCVHVTLRVMTAEDRGPVSPIGKALPGWTLHLADRDGAPVPDGVPGELWVGGAGPARGYLGRPALTAQRFVPDPCAAVPGARAYRSGDLGLRDADGAFTYQGRTDFQVKIRGFRIEPGEINACLAALDGVAESAVLVKQAGDGSPVLMGYVVPAPGADPEPAQLRAALAARLPAHMVPAHLCVVAQFPLTAHGKLDRGRLPDPAQVLAEREVDRGPLTPTEERLAEVFASVLGATEVGRNDHFFELGGDSIRGIRLIAAARDAGLSFNLQQLFGMPRVADLAREIDLAEGGGDGPVRTAPFELVDAETRAALPADVEDAYPLAALQAGMLYEMQQQDAFIVYQDVTSLEIQGRLDEAAMRRSLQLLCARHPIFRTSLHLTGFHEPLQLVHRETEVALIWRDLRTLPAQAARAEIAAYVASEKSRPFPLIRPRLIDYAFHIIDDDTFHFTQTLCHPIMDGWSTSSAIAELFDTYFDIQTHGDAAPKPAPALTYRDFVAAERRAVKDDGVRAFWQNELAGYAPFSLPRPPAEACAPAPADLVVEQRWTLPAEQVRDLRALATEAGTGLKAVFLAAYFKVLSQLSGRLDVAGGVQTNGRAEEAGGEEVLGLFLNAMPARMQLRPGSWAQLTAEAFAVEKRCLPYRRMPMTELQRGFDVPLFETFFNFVSFHAVSDLLRARNLRPGKAPEYSEPTSFTFFNGFNLDPVEDTLLVVLQTYADRWPAEQLALARALYEQVFEAMARAGRGDDRAHHLSALLPPSEHRRLRVFLEAGAPQAVPPLTAVIAARAHAAADRPAVRFGDQCLTYAQLWRQACTLAARLRAHGVGAEDRVAVLSARCLHLPGTLLGVLLAGAAYVPLDPSNPRERLSFMAEDAAAAMLLTTRELADHALVQTCERRLFVDDAAPETDGFVPTSGHDHQAAYMIYTSGSTGRPKGAINSLRAVGNRIFWMADYLGVTDDDVFLQKTPFSFDVSVWEFFLPMATGTPLVVAEPDLHKDAFALAALMRRTGVTCVHFVPSMLGVFLEQKNLESLTALRSIVCSGEALPHDLTTKTALRLPDVALHNLYGPTEAAVDVTAQDMGACPYAGLVPIGKTIRGAAMHVLDPFLQPVPVGTQGELYIGGTAPGRGYHGRPGLTAERFLPDAHTAEPGARLYRTGDLARYLPDGSLHYLGRVDDQIKLRGFRIELGEIQAVLAVLPGVRQAAVDLRRDSAGQGVLVAYVVTDGAAGDEALRARLVAALGERLPSYMVPTRFVFMDALPIGTHGKLDRRALPDPADAAETRTAYTPPHTPTETRLAAVWADVLGRPRVGRDDNFFALGGDSIISLHLVARAAEAGLSFTIAQLQTLQTVAALAEQIDSGEAVEALPEPIGPFALIDASLRARLPEDVEDAYPMTQTQLGMIYHMQAEPELKPYFNVDCCLFEGRIEEAAFREAVALVIARHAALRTALHPDGYGPPLQLVHRTAVMRIDWEDLRGLDAATQKTRVREMYERQVAEPFDLHRPPLIRYAVQLLSDNSFQLTLVEHHALVDGWSFNSLLAEVFAACFQLMKGEAVTAPPQPRVAYRDFVHWEQLALASERSRRFWTDALAGHRVLSLPTWHVAEDRRADVPLVRANRPLSAAKVQVLESLARKAGTPLKSVLLAAHYQTLALLSGSRDVLTGVMVTGRPELEGGDRIHGLFFNTLPLRVTVDAAGWPELIAAVFAAETAAMPHRRVPLATIQKYAGGTPLFDVLFNYVNFHVLLDVMSPGNLMFVRKDHGKDPTNYHLTVDFSRDPGTGDLYVLLRCPPVYMGAHCLDRVADVYAHVLETMVRATQTDTWTITPAELVPPVERAVVAGFQAARSVAAPGLNAALDAWATRAPLAPAVCYGDTTWTVAALRGRVLQWAALLADLGAAPGRPVFPGPLPPHERLAAETAVLRLGAMVVTSVPGPEGRPASRPASTLVVNEMPSETAPAPERPAATGSFLPPAADDVARAVPEGTVCAVSADTAARLGLNAGGVLALVVPQGGLHDGYLHLTPLLVGACLHADDLHTAVDPASAVRADVVAATPACWSLLLHPMRPAWVNARLLCMGGVDTAGLRLKLRDLGALLLYPAPDTGLWGAAAQAERDGFIADEQLGGLNQWPVDARGALLPMGVSGRLCLRLPLVAEVVATDALGMIDHTGRLIPAPPRPDTTAPADARMQDLAARLGDVLGTVTGVHARLFDGGCDLFSLERCRKAVDAVHPPSAAALIDLGSVAALAAHADRAQDASPAAENDTDALTAELAALSDADLADLLHDFDV